MPPLSPPSPPPPLPLPLRRRPSPPLLIAAAVIQFTSLFSSAHTTHPPSCGFSPAAADHNHHHPPSCGHDHHHDHQRALLAEEEGLELDGFDLHDHHHFHDGGSDLEFSTIGLWTRAMGCSLLVSMASLICLAILPLIFVQGKPSKVIVDSLALFGAGAMLGDAFLHQLPHAFAGILLFLLVEKVVRFVEEHPGNGASNLGHGHHRHKHNNKLKADDVNRDSSSSELDNKLNGDTRVTYENKMSDGESDGCLNDDKSSEHEILPRKRVTSTSAIADDRKDTYDGDGSLTKKPSSIEIAPPTRLPSNLVFGYLNLFSDGVHNFTDGMALGSAFLLHGSVGGWSRTLFLLVHELPQEVGDFGISVRSGFTVFKSLAFNFLSALVALAGTALALVLGKQPGHLLW